LGYSAGRVGTPARPSQPPRKCLLSRCHSGCSSLSHLPREPPGPLSPSLARALTVRWRRRRQRVAERLRLVGVGVVVEGAAQVRRLRRARLRYLLLLALAAALHLLACFGVPCTPSHTHTHTRRLSMCRLPSRANINPRKNERSEYRRHLLSRACLSAHALGCRIAPTAWDSPPVSTSAALNTQRLHQLSPFRAPQLSVGEWPPSDRSDGGLGVTAQLALYISSVFSPAPLAAAAAAARAAAAAALPRSHADARLPCKRHPSSS
jgi:hypothetical protein